VPKPKNSAAGEPAPLTIEQLESGLRVLADRSADLSSFWDENVESFRQTLIHAVRDTSDALLSRDIPLRWKIALESQLQDLVRHIELADRYISSRPINCERTARAFPSAFERVH
jgi:hypothetical protein